MKILKEAKENDSSCRREFNNIHNWLLIKTNGNQKVVWWQSIYSKEKGKKKSCQARILQVANPVQNLESKVFPDKRRLKKFAASRPTLEEILTEVLQTERH